MNLREPLDPPPAGARFAVNNVVGGGVPQVADGYGEVTDTAAVLWIADGDGHRKFWCQYHASDIQLPSGSGTFRVRQARLGFEAGWTVSIIFGSSTWSSNRDTPFSDMPFTETPGTVELAVLDRAGCIVTDEPLSHVTADLALAVIDVVASLPTDADAGDYLAVLG